MAGKNPLLKKKSKLGQHSDNFIDFSLPDSLPCSEIEFPVMVRRPNRANWGEILEESHQFHKELEEYVKNKKEPVPRGPFIKTECDYMQRLVLNYLIPALVETLNKAATWKVLKIQKCFFNGIDHIAQVLWNNNPRYPIRKQFDLHIFNMPWVRDHLKKKFKYISSSRPYYPKSWLWPEEYAATLIQKTVRQYFVQRDEEVQEMRDFWRKVVAEPDLEGLDTNPLLAKKFASLQTFHRKL